MGKFSVVSPLRAAVKNEKSWIPFAGDVIERFEEIAGDLGAVFALELDVFAVGELELGEEGVVDVGELGKFSVDECVDFIGAVEGGDLGGDIAVGAVADRVGADHDAAREGASALLTIAKIDLGQILGAVVINDEVDGFSIGREMGCVDVAVEGEGEDFGGATGCG